MESKKEENKEKEVERMRERKEKEKVTKIEKGKSVKVKKEDQWVHFKERKNEIKTIKIWGGNRKGENGWGERRGKNQKIFSKVKSDKNL